MLEKFKRVLRKVTGISTPLGGISWTAAEQDIKKRVESVVNTYRSNAHSHPPKTNGFNGLIQAGVFILMNDNEIREVCDGIKAFGDKSPLGKYEEMLQGVDLYNFFSLAKEHDYNFLTQGNPKEIVEELRRRQKHNGACPTNELIHRHS